MKVHMLFQSVARCVYVCITPADEHGSDNGLPARVQQLTTGRVFGRDDHPQRSQRHEEGTHQRRHIWVRV